MALNVVYRTAQPDAGNRFPLDSGSGEGHAFGIRCAMPFATSGWEMRSSRRFRMRLPLELQYAAGESRREESHTRDISSRGICFYLDTDLAVGSSIKFVLVLPPEITLTESIRVRCTGTVVRVERPPAPGARLLVAATIQQYEYLGREQSN